MISVNYKTKAELQKAVGKKLEYKETSQFGTEYQTTGTFTVASKDSKWEASITMKDDIIEKVE